MNAVDSKCKTAAVNVRKKSTQGLKETVSIKPSQLDFPSKDSTIVTAVNDFELKQSISRRIQTADTARSKRG